MSRVAYPRPRDEGGQILILTSAVIIAMLFLGAVVVDVGNWYVHRRHLQTQVDAAALAAAASFGGCFLTQANANTNVANTALLYAGDTSRQPSGAPSPPINVQVTPDTAVHVVLNADDYWPTATADGWTAANPGGWATSDAQKPCTVKYIDVKATDDSVPGLLRLIPFRPNIHANARVEIRKGQGFTGLLPWAVPSGDPTYVFAIFFNEANGNVLRAQQLNKGSYVPLNGTSLRDWAADVSVDLQPQTGVVILTSQSATVPSVLATVGQMCAQTDATCFGGNTQTDGLALVRTITNGAAASAANPKLTDVSFGAGSCSTDTSAGYYVLTADCNPNVTAKIDFGVANPVIAPTFARVTLNGPGCPCTMAWQQATNTWVLDTGTPLLASLSGQNAYSLSWQSGGAGPGASQVALVTPTAPSSPAAVAAAPAPIAPAKPLPLTRGLAMAANASSGDGTLVVNPNSVVAGSTGNTLGFTFTTAGGNAGDFRVAGSNFTITVPAGWSVPQTTTPGGAGYVSLGTVSCGGGSGSATPAASASGNVITVTNQCNGGASIVVSYANATAPAAAGSSVFSATSRIGATGGSALGSSPTVTVTAPPTGTVKVIKTVTGGGPKVASNFTLNATVTGGTATPPSVTGSTTGTDIVVTANKAYSITETAVTDYTPSYSAACGGQVTAGQTVTCTVTNAYTPGGGLPAASGTFALVGRPYATNLASGPVDYLLLTDGASNRTYFYTSGGTKTIHVEVGLEPSIRAATGPSDPPLTLRFGSGSRTQLLDCDHANRNADDEIETGCYTGYSINPPPGDCSAYGGGGSTLPPQLPPPQTFPNCVAVANGATVGQVRAGLDRRFGQTASECAQHPNKWAVYQGGGQLPALSDNRYVVLILTDFDTFSGGGAGKVPVRRFAGFYVTGWSSASNACANAANNENPPPGTQASSNKAEVWGHFVNYVAPSNDNDPGPDLCAFDSTDICIAVLTR